MKRTQETWNNPHPTWQERQGISGCKEFDGEDLTFDSRVQYFQNQQKSWFDEQVKQHQLSKQMEARENDLYASQTLEVTRMRGMLEDEFTRKKTEIKVSHTNHNLDMAQEQRETRENDRQQRLAEERAEIQRLHQRGVKRPYVNGH